MPQKNTTMGLARVRYAATVKCLRQARARLMSIGLMSGATNKGDYMKCSDSIKSVKAKREFVARQTKEARLTGDVTLRNCGEIRTGTIPVWEAFRCLYCGEYFNQTMAEEHFGMTREQFFDQ